MSLHTTKMLILGGGPAGLTAAIYAARAALAPLVVQGMQPGGQLTTTTEVENFPGFVEAIQGPWLMEQMAAQARAVGATLLNDHIASLDLSTRPFQARGESGDTYEAATVVIATGAQARWLGLESETRFRGFGVSGCATCDGFFFRGKDVIVIGGGNSAMEEALFLTNHARHVTLVHRRDSFRGEVILRDRIATHPKISVVWNSVVEEIVGVEEPMRSVTGVRVRDVQTNATRVLEAEGVFVAIGHDPATALVKGQLAMDAQGYILTKPDSTATEIEGVYAAGDVRDKVFRQAVTSAGMGCMAALEAERFLSAHAPKNEKP